MHIKTEIVLKYLNLGEKLELGKWTGLGGILALDMEILIEILQFSLNIFLSGHLLLGSAVIQFVVIHKSSQVLVYK